MDEYSVSTSEILHRQEVVNASSLSSFAALLMLARDYLTQQRYSEATTIFAQMSDQLPFPHTDFLNSLETFLQQHTRYLLIEKTLKGTCIQFAEASTALSAQATLLGERLQAFIQNLEILLYSQASHGVSSSDPPEKEPSSSPHPISQNSSSSHDRFSSSDASPDAHLPEKNDTPVELFVTCFNHFEVRLYGKAIPLCSSRAGQAILRYLVVKAGHSATSDTLKDLFWPEDEPEAAQRKLHHAISSLRLAFNHCLPTGSRGECIIFKAGLYALSPQLKIHTDVDEFLKYYRVGQGSSEEQARCYEKACQLYSGPFLIEDLYADWSALQREQLSKTYFTMCRALTGHFMQHGRYEDAEKWAMAVLKESPCDETCHRQLMQIYAAQGRRSDAIRQYRQCESILRAELAVQPLPETTTLLQTILTTTTEPKRSENGELT